MLALNQDSCESLFVMRNELTYKTYSVLCRLSSGVELIEIVACDLDAAKADFDQAIGLEHARGPWNCKEGW